MESRQGKTARPAVAAVLDTSERHDFDTLEAFHRFIAGTRHGDAVRRTRDAAGRSKPLKPADVETLKTKTYKIERELSALAERTGLAPNSRELFERATVKREPDEPEIFDATLLFQDPGFGGAAVPLYGDVYDLDALGGWRGRVGSVLSDRSLTLFSDTGFRGNQCWVFAPQGGYATVDDLGWFNGLAASLLYQR
jgi:hypothetical protein